MADTLKILNSSRHSRPLIRGEKEILRKRCQNLEFLIGRKEMAEEFISETINEINNILSANSNEIAFSIKNEIEWALKRIPIHLNMMNDILSVDKELENEIEKLYTKKREKAEIERKKRLEYFNMKNRPPYWSPDYDEKIYGKKPKGF